MTAKRCWRRDDQGVTAVEFALLLPLFLLLLLAIINFGMIYFNYSRIERGVFMAQKNLTEGTAFASVAELKAVVCREAGISCDAEGFVVEVTPLTATPMAQASDALVIKPGEPHLLRAVYPWSGVFPAGALSYIGLSNLESSSLQVGVFFYVKK